MNFPFIVAAVAVTVALWWVALRGLAADVLGPLAERCGSRSWLR